MIKKNKMEDEMKNDTIVMAILSVSVCILIVIMIK